MSDNFFFPVFTGLLTKEHREKMGPAIWEFLWFISKTTKEETTENGESIGIVLGGRPVKTIEIAQDLGVSLRTAENNISKLKKGGYITTKRTPYGNVFSVRNSKKFYKRTAENYGSIPKENRKKKGREPQESVLRTAESCGCNKDIKDIKNINTTRQQKMYDEDNTYFKMATYFYSKVEVVTKDAGISHLIKKSNMHTWADDMRKLIEIDKVDKRLVKEVMDWVTQDPFWRTNVLSAKKLREKFMELAIKMKADNKKQKPKKEYDSRDKEISFQRWIADGNNPEDFDWSG